MGRNRWGIACGLAAASIALAGPAQAAVPHTVQPGETLWSISAANNFTTRTLAAFNGLAEDAQLVSGTTIQIPTESEGAAALASAASTTPSSSAPAATGGGTAHVVQPGETLWSISAANNFTTRTVAAFNGLAEDALLVAGTTIEIPTEEQGAAALASAGATPAAPAISSSASWLASIDSPYGPLQLDAGAAASWNSMRSEALSTYGVDMYPGGPLSAYRTYDQQASLYDLFLSGQGEPANPPGTSTHELGIAVDLAAPEMRSVIDQIGAAYGWQATHSNEWWHIEYWG